MAKAHVIRSLALGASALLSLGGGWLYMRFIGNDGTSALDVLRTALFTLVGFWLVWGGVAGVLGILAPPKRVPVAVARPKGMTAVSYTHLTLPTNREV